VLSLAGGRLPDLFSISNFLALISERRRQVGTGGFRHQDRGGGSNA
jgi:hypothetical protein